jgi:hypothetical protein
MADVEAQAAPPDFNNASGDAIHIEVTKNPSDHMEVLVTVYSWSPVRVQPDEFTAEVPVLEVVPPTEDTPGTYQTTFSFTSEGAHRVVAWNNTCTCEAEAFAGDIPAWNPDKYQKTGAQIMAIERQKAAAIAGTTGRLNG